MAALNTGRVRWFGLATRTFHAPAGRIAPQVVAAMLQRGVIARAMPQGDIIGFAPPLCITRPEVDIVLDAVRFAIAETL